MHPPHRARAFIVSVMVLLVVVLLVVVHKVRLATGFLPRKCPLKRRARAAEHMTSSPDDYGAILVPAPMSAEARCQLSKIATAMFLRGADSENGWSPAGERAGAFPARPLARRLSGTRSGGRRT